MRVIGIDFGERRIGLALSDADGRWALPFRMVERSTDRRAVYRIAALAREHEVERLVVGEPRERDGSAGERVERVRRFAAKLARATGLPIDRVDETLTTVEAAERLGAAGFDSRVDPGRRDAVAAQVLLQEALERGRPESAGGMEKGG